MNIIIVGTVKFIAFWTAALHILCPNVQHPEAAESFVKGFIGKGCYFKI